MAVAEYVVGTGYMTLWFDVNLVGAWYAVRMGLESPALTGRAGWPECLVGNW